MYLDGIFAFIIIMRSSFVDEMEWGRTSTSHNQHQTRWCGPVPVTSTAPLSSAKQHLKSLVCTRCTVSQTTEHLHVHGYFQ